MRTSGPLAAALTATALLVAAGCGSADTTSSGSSGGTSSTAAGAIQHPTGANDVVVRVVTGGGFVPVEVNLASVPSYTLYGDGTVIRTVAAPEGAAPTLAAATAQPLETAKLDEAAVQQLLAQAKVAGLLGASQIDYGDMGAVGISDMPTTSVTIAADGQTAERAAYALGAGGDSPGHTLSAAQQNARTALSGFVALTTGDLPGAATYTPERLAVYVGPGLAQPTDTDAAAPTVPLTNDLPALTAQGANSAAGFGCTVVEGDQATALLAAMAKGPADGVWRGPKGDTGTYRIVVRPLLPDEAGCPA
jgi:hypothetical protein